MEFLLFLLGAVIGCVVTYVILRERERRMHVGTLRVDRSIPEEEPYLFLELKTGVGDIMFRSSVMMDVKVENYISQD